MGCSEVPEGSGAPAWLPPPRHAHAESGSGRRISAPAVRLARAATQRARPRRRGGAVAQRLPSA
eukprot:CAMPEP_0179915608 /NCGR_PEP_ID=MMETSP0983-20121128/1768_1 /TAXON_ID=483367 /ORGANISM="non described non described, Strain CCMP 2436" /LENGTH=63 /DNA_ID=CAMNT_0021818043 /DNA_START=508 /DNA_END=699 /DNA_ORIENTATION=+